MSVTVTQSSPQQPTVRPSAAIGFALVHLAALGVFLVGFSWQGVALALASYYLRMFAITAGYHRYFSHRAFKLNRFWQFALAFLGQTSAQKGVLWWAAHHRHHHRYSDQPEDLHSPMQRGFWWSHMGWILADDYAETRYEAVPDLARFPELVWLNRNQYLPTLLYAVALTAAFGWTGLFYGYFLSTVLLWHGTFSINSIMHVFGRRVYKTTDDSRNSMIFALVTMGEGWHNNHHYYPGSAAQGFRWWQLDMSYYALLIGEKLRIVKDMRRVPQRVLFATEEAMQATQTAFDQKIEELSAQWMRMRQSAQVKAHHAVEELEAARQAAAARVKQLETEYLLLRARAGAAASRKVDEILADLERTKQQLAETLERLVTTAASVPAYAN